MPADGKFLGDWKEGKKVANNGRGGQFSDDEKTVSGGNCYACHQLEKAELSYGTIGPSLTSYGKDRKYDPDDVKRAYIKIYNSQALQACSNMPRFGVNKYLTEQQIKDLVALLFDPESPVNQLMVLLTKRPPREKRAVLSRLLLDPVGERRGLVGFLAHIAEHAKELGRIEQSRHARDFTRLAGRATDAGGIFGEELDRRRELNSIACGQGLLAELASIEIGDDPRADVIEMQDLEIVARHTPRSSDPRSERGACACMPDNPSVPT